MNAILKPASSMHPDEWAARVELAACYRVFAMLGWTEMIYNHITVRLPASVAGSEKQFLINPFGLHYTEVTASNLLKIDVQGRKLDDNPWPVNPAGFTIHSAVHEVREDAGCVMHLHTPDGTAVSSSKEKLLPLNQTAQLVTGDLGTSIFFRRDVLGLIAKALPATLELVAAGMLLGVTFGMIGGIGWGDPTDAGNFMGPLVSKAQQDRVLGYINTAVEEGATIVTGGKAGALEGDLAGGFFVEPTVLTGVDQNSTIAQEEVFGPVLAVIPHDGDDDAVYVLDAQEGEVGYFESLWRIDLETYAHAFLYGGLSLAPPLERAASWARSGASAWAATIPQ